ncbi:hypothetical protein [Endozoicomonas sp. ONNA2]|nr:hypothetical protein [Endozoicomonas sp. ONNA2]
MHHIPIRRLIKTPLMLCILSWFAIADTTSQASALAAEWTPPP